MERTLTTRMATLVLCGALAVALSGCAQAANNKPAVAPKPASGAMKATNPAMSKMASQPVDPDTQQCANCAGKGMAPMVMGMAKTVDGVQIIKIGLKDGYYSPNQFTVAPGIPVKVTFTGKAIKCLGKPMFKSLNKKADFTKTGSATIDLGSLSGGTYEFSCGMGMTGGKIVVPQNQ